MLKTVSSVINAIGALNYQGTWNASTNTPTLTSGVGTKGDYYVVSVAGSTNLDGTTLWGVGDWAVFNGSIWQKVDGGSTGDFTNLSVSGTATFSGQLVNSVMFLNASKNLATDSSFSYDGVNGRLGVGTNSPNKRITAQDVSGLQLDLYGTGAGYTSGIQFRNDNSAYGQFKYVNGSFVWDNNNGSGEVMRLNSSGNLGIGTSSPAGVLEVVGTNGVLISRSSKTASTNSGARFMGGAYTGNLATAILLDGINGENQLTVGGGTGIGEPATSIRFNTGTAGTVGAGTEQMRLTSTGLGIGTSDPQARLVSAGSSATNFKALILRNGDGTTGSSASLDFEASSGTGGLEASLAGRIAGVRVGSGTTGALDFFTTNGGTLGSSKMRLDSSGNLGLGTTSPGAAIGILRGAGSNAFIEAAGNNGTPGSTSMLYGQDGSNAGYVWNRSSAAIYFATANTERMRLDSSGRLGIGVTGPNNNLQVKTASDGGGITIQRDSTTADTYAQLSFLLSTGEGGTSNSWIRGIRNSVSASSLTFGTSNTEQMRIDSSGNLGIGTSSPGAKLDVNGGNANTEVRINHADNVSGRTVTLRMSSTQNASYTGAGAYIQAIQGAGVDVYSLAFGTTQGSTSASERMRIDSFGNLLIGTTTTGASKLVVNSDSIQVNTAKTPASATATGTTGQIAWDANYIYVCTATNTWKRVAIATW